MALHQKVSSSGIYFITFTCHKWLPLIEEVKAYDLVCKWFDILVVAGHGVTGYVIMSNHLHLLLHYQSGNQSLNTIIGNGKRLLAYEIVDRLKQEGKEALLAKLEAAVKPKDK